MTELTEHARTILRAIADGKIPQERNYEGNSWVDCSCGRAMKLLSVFESDSLRIKPETRSINGVEFAAPVEDSDYHMQIGLLQFTWPASKDRDTAYLAIVDALEGKTK